MELISNTGTDHQGRLYCFKTSETDFHFQQINTKTKRPNIAVNSPTSHPGNIGLKSRPGDRLSWL